MIIVGDFVNEMDKAEAELIGYTFSFMTRIRRLSKQVKHK
jgi:hypothetical protein